MEACSVVGVAYGRVGRAWGVERANVKRCLVEKFESNCVARVENLELENAGHGQMFGAGLAVSLMAATLASCPPAMSADMNSASTMYLPCFLLL